MAVAANFDVNLRERCSASPGVAASTMEYSFFEIRWVNGGFHGVVGRMIPSLFSLSQSRDQNQILSTSAMLQSIYHSVTMDCTYVSHISTTAYARLRGYD